MYESQVEKEQSHDLPGASGIFRPRMLSVLQQEAALWKAEASLPDHFPGAS